MPAPSMAAALSVLVVAVGAVVARGEEVCNAPGACGSDAAENLLLQRAQANRGRQDPVARWLPGASAEDDDPEDYVHGVQRRRRYVDMGSCRRRHSTQSKNPPEEADEPWQCRGTTMVKVGSSTPSPAPAPAPPQCGGSTDGGAGACLCVFDIDRTLTGRQGDTRRCPDNRVLDLWDKAYGGGKATLSALTNAGIATTFCNYCQLGITSAGTGSGEGSEWNDYLLNRVMRGDAHDSFMLEVPNAKRWSYGTDVRSPYVLGQSNRKKQESVELIRQWYGERGLCIEPSEVYFFEDRTENVAPFREKGLNSREISCGSRDPELYGGSGMVGYCGARPEEVQRVKGNVPCP